MERRAATAARLGALLLLAGVAAAGIVQSDASDLCTSNLAACQQQCITAGQFAFQVTDGFKGRQARSSCCKSTDTTCTTASQRHAQFQTNKQTHHRSLPPA
jgi:hypothetical protein